MTTHSKHTAHKNEGTEGAPVTRTHDENVQAAEMNVERERKLAVVGATENYLISGRQYRRRGRPLNQPIEALPQKGSVFGKFMGIQTLKDRSNNPVMGRFDKPLEYFELVGGDGEVKQYWSNGGLKGAIALARANAGDVIEIEATGETALFEERDRELPVYRIYALEEQAHGTT